MNHLIENGKEVFNTVNSDARCSANEIFEECYSKQQAEQDKIFRDYQLRCEEIKLGRVKFRVENLNK